MYVPKDYWMICQRTGIKTRRSQMRKEWTGLWVRKTAWEPRHPQDFIKSIPDNQSVTPSFPDVQQTVGETTLYANVEAWDRRVLIPTASLSDKDVIGIQVNDSSIHWTFIDGDPTTLDGDPYIDSNGYIYWDSNNELYESTDDPLCIYITLNTPVPKLASLGNAVYLPSINNESWA